MKKDRGFTLVELLTVIVILSLLMAIAVPNIMGISKKMKTKGFNSKIESFEQAAVVYAQNNSNKIKNKLGANCTSNSNYCKCDDYIDPITKEHSNDCHYQFSMTVEDLVALNAYSRETESGECLVKDPTDENKCLDCTKITVKIDDDHKNAFAKIDKENLDSDPGLIKFITLFGEQDGFTYKCTGGESEVTPPASTTDNTMMEVTSGNIWQHKSDITKIVLETSKNPKSGASYTYDVSKNQDKGVMAYLVPTSEDSTKYTLYLQANGKIIAPQNSRGLFENFTNLERIDNLENLNTENVTTMEYMFNGCSALTSLNLSNFDTSKVKDMSYMFYCCKSLTSLNLSSFNTSNVIYMSQMFSGCEEIVSLNVSSFNTSKVTAMAAMFRECKKLESLNLSNFDTSNVTSLAHMFYNCNNLSTLNISGFRTSNVTDMSWMFLNCYKLSSLDVSKFDTSKVTTMAYMFKGLESLTSLNVSNFNTSKVTAMNGMFCNLYSLSSLNLNNFNTSNVTNMELMFSGSKMLTTLNLNNFDTSKVTNMSSMFWECTSLASLNLTNFNTTKVTDMKRMFNGCKALESLNISRFDISSVSSRSLIFTGMPSTTRITVGNTTVKDWVLVENWSHRLTETNIIVA